jgi:hypothetical protein
MWKDNKVTGSGAGDRGAIPWKPSQTILGCTRKATTALNTVTVTTDIGVKGEIKFLIDTGAELCLLKYTSIKDGTVYRLTPH